MRLRLLLLWAGALAAAACSLDELCVEGDVGCSLDPCHNRVLDAGETDIDCGGACAGCAAGATCTVDDDCLSARCDGGRCCAPPCPRWTHTFGGADDDQVTGAARLDDGTIVVAGQFSGSIDLGAGPRSAAGDLAVFVAGYGPDGTHRFDRVIDGAPSVYEPEVARGLGDHVWVAGQYTGGSLALDGEVLDGNGAFNDGFLVELDGSGAVVRTRSFLGGGGGFVVRRLLPVGDGGLALLAQIGSIDFGDGVVETGPGVHGVLARLDPLGARVWSRRLGGSGDDYPLGMSVAGDSIFVGVNYRGGDTSLGGPTLPVTPGEPGNGDFAIALGEIGLDGAHRWSRGFEAPTWVNDIAADAGGIYAAGILVGRADLGAGVMTPVGTTDLLVGRFDPHDGTPVWLLQAGDNDSAATAITTLGDGSVLLAGSFSGSVALTGGASAAGGVDSLLLARIGADGTAAWAARGGGIFLGAHVGVLAAPDQALVFGGFAGTLDIAGARSAGGFDGFVTAFLP